jgi:transcriptional regulator with XRE-family HTH domain
MTTRRNDAQKFLDELVGPLTFGSAIASIRQGEEQSQVQFSRRLKISPQNLCDIEKGRKSVGLRRVIQWAKLLGYSEILFVALAPQDQVNAETGNEGFLVSVKKKPQRRKVA